MTTSRCTQTLHRRRVPPRAGSVWRRSARCPSRWQTRQPPRRIGPPIRRTAGSRSPPCRRAPASRAALPLSTRRSTSTRPTSPPAGSWSPSRPAPPTRATRSATKRCAARISSTSRGGRRRVSRPRGFTAAGNGRFEAQGKLTIRDVTRPVTPAIHVRRRCRRSDRAAQRRHDDPAARFRCGPGRMERHDLGRQRGRHPFRPGTDPRRRPCRRNSERRRALTQTLRTCFRTGIECAAAAARGRESLHSTNNLGVTMPLRSSRLDPRLVLVAAIALAAAGCAKKEAADRRLRPHRRQPPRTRSKVRSTSSRGPATSSAARPTRATTG